MIRALERRPVRGFHLNEGQASFLTLELRNEEAGNGSFFNTQRMVQQYVVKAYFE